MKSLRLIICSLLTVSTSWSQSHRVESNQVVVNQGHWREWTVAKGTVQFDSDGVRPQFIREKINAVLNASNFVYENDVQGGIRSAGTGLAEATNIIDGKETTFWEPDFDAPLRNWWVEIDLGRLVWARKIVVKFAQEDLGDPFLQFKVLTSNGLPAFSQSKTLRYVLAGRSEGLNKTQRTFEFDLTPSQEADVGFVGDMFQFVQIVATASDKGRGQKISKSRWAELPQDERGDVLHFLRESSGILREVDKSQYEALVDEARKGPIEYYRRERPRLVEVEVWTGGDNISLGALDRGGMIGGTSNAGTEKLAIDGDYKTVWNEQVGVSGVGNNIDVEFDRELFLDLGAWFWINRAVISFDRENIAHGFTGAFPNYVVNLSEGLRNPDGSLSYESLAKRETAEQEPGRFSGLFPHIFYQDNVFPTTKARFFKMDYRVLIVPNWANAGIRELQFYGHGFLPQVTLTSVPIELGTNPRVLSTISWEAETPTGTQIRLRTRTGNTLKQDIRYFTTTGLEVTKEKYRKLLSFQRGDSTVTVIPGEDWSPWSAPYLDSNASVTSPSPRRYLMVEAVLSSDDPDRSALLHSMSIGLDTPLASRILGEIDPPILQQLGQREDFTLFLQPQFQGQNQGFDQILVELPPSMAVELTDVFIGTDPELQSGTGQRFERDQIEILSTSADSLWIRLPTVVSKDAALVALRFTGALYLASNAFTAQVGLEENGKQIWQRVDAGDASSIGIGQGLTVLNPFTGSLLGEVKVSSNPFTPNGDGVNEVVELSFTVFKVQGSKALLLEVFGLDGRQVRQVQQPTEFAAGQQRVVWDGRDDSGQLLPPGLYMCRVGLDVDAEGIQPIVVKLVASVY